MVSKAYLEAILEIAKSTGKQMPKEEDYKYLGNPFKLSKQKLTDIGKPALSPSKILVAFAGLDNKKALEVLKSMGL